MAREAPAEELGHGQGAAAAKMAAEEQCPDDVPDLVDRDERQHERTVARVRHAHLAEEGRRAEEARDQRADDQECGRPPAGHEVVVEVLDLAPRIRTDHQVHREAHEDTGRERVHGRQDPGQTPKYRPPPRRSSRAMRLSGPMTPRYHSRNPSRSYSSSEDGPGS